MTFRISAVALGEKLIPVHLAAFASVELVNADLNVTAETFELHLISFTETFFDLILIHRDDADEEFVRIVKTTGTNRLIHELGEFVWELNGYLGHDVMIVSSHTRFVEWLNQRSESSSLTCWVSWRSASSMASLAPGSRLARREAMQFPSRWLSWIMLLVRDFFRD